MRALPALAVMLAPAVALAGGYLVPNTNPRDLALGQSTVSSTEGAEATYVNAATLAEHLGLTATLSLGVLDFHPTWVDPNHASSDVTVQTHLVTPFVFAVAYGFKVGGHPLGIGLSFNVAGGGVVFWPPSWPGASSIISVDRRIYQGTLGAGFEIIPQLKIGLSLLYFRTTEELTQALPFGTTTGRADLGTAGGQFSFAASLEANPIKDLAIGAQYQHLATQDLSGHVHFSDVPPPFQSQLIDQTVTHELTFPNILHVGASYNIMERVRVLFGYQWTRFIDYREDKFVGGLTAVTVTVPRNYINGNTFRLGAEGIVVKWLRLYLGGRRDVTPQPTDTLSPTLPDSSSWAISAGFAVDVAPFLRLAGAYEYTRFDEVSSSGPDTFPATYRSYAHLGSIGLQFRWQ